MKLRKKIMGLLQKNKAINKFFTESLKDMDDEKFYIEALNLFVGIGKNAEAAIEDWSNIIALVANFKKKFDSDTNLSIIILYYFIEVKKEIVHPFILDYFTYNNLKNSVIYDHLTKVYNRNFFEKIIKLENR